VPGSSMRLFSPFLSLAAGTIPSSRAAVVNSCSSTAEHLCNFVCYCSDCSDENQCGYLGVSAALGTPFTCDFEEGDCGWQDVSTTAYRWVRGQASLDKWGTGLHSDHTVGTDRGKWESDAATAWLRSPVMRDVAATCEIRASYHLSGSGECSWVPTVVELWQSPQHGAEGWHQLVAYTGRITGQFQPPARGAVLALDDIVFRNCGLQSESCGCWDAAGWHPRVAVRPLCSCGAGDSSPMGMAAVRGGFPVCREHHMGPGLPWPFAWGEQQVWGWLVASPAPAGSTELLQPHLCEHPMGRGGSVLLLSSPGLLTTTPRLQLVLYCHLHGSATSSLSISYMTNTTEQLVRERTGDTGSCWVRERVDFNVTESFKGCACTGLCCHGRAVLAGDTWWGYSWKRQCWDNAWTQVWPHTLPVLHSSLGLSPSDPSPTALPGQDRAGTCTAREFTCDDESCISSELACDFAKTCTDGSDEKLCGATTFEEGDGGWHDVSVGRLRWAVQRATEPRAIALVGAGSFLALQEGEGQMVAPAKARTPLLGPSGPACSMEMSYHIQSGPQGSPCLAWGQLPDTAWQAGQCWCHQQPGAHRNHPQVELLGLVDLQDPADAAIDNVTFVQCDPDVLPPGTTELSCNFETGLCGWYQDQASDFQWVHSTGQGQGSDHTTGSGYFLAANPSAPWSRGQRAQLITYGQEPATTPRCLTFWYRLAGPQIGTLNLKLQLEGAEETVLWTQRGTQGSLWHRGLATLPATGRQRYRLAFEALRDGFVGDVALDDLLVTEGTCGAELSCSFEADACGLTGSKQPTWLRQSNSTGTIAGPPADHTTGTAAGHYMVVSTSKGSLPMGHKATLTSAPYQPSAPAQCLAFWYQLSTGDPGEPHVPLAMYRRSAQDAWVLWGCSRHATVQADGDWKAIFEVVGAGGDHGYIALDDLHVSDGACPEPGGISCDFELDMCGWSSPTDERLHGFAWGWKSGVPLAKYPGPEQDHTLGTKDGHYVHFDTRVLGAGGTTAQLESQHLPATADSCLRFWYHMDIPEHLSDGELRVRLRSASGLRTAWSVAGHPSRGWRSSTVPVQSPSEFQIIFEITTRMWPMEGTPALPSEESSRGFVAEVVLSLLLVILILALAVAGGWYWLKRRGQGSRMAAESSTPQGFDNITFRDVRSSPGPQDEGAGLSHLPSCPQQQKQPFLKSSANSSRHLVSLQSANTSERCKGLCFLSGHWQMSDPRAVGLT
uniref:MAM domain containing 4 n=1 Tax=Anser brachyrhynchus TaxID=132585 RepID=A0A8B9CKU2_9AVES